MTTKPDPMEIAKSLRLLRRKPVSNEPKGLPKATSNSNKSDGTYTTEDLTDPGYDYNGVTGTGEGPALR